MLDNAQAQSIAPGRGIQFCREQPTDHLFGHTDASIAHHHAYRGCIRTKVQKGYPYGYLSDLGELDSIMQQIYQHLREADRVTCHLVGYYTLYFIGKLQVLLTGEQGYRVYGCSNHILDAESFASQHRLLMGKQGEVEQILDEMCYMETAGPDLRDIGGLPLVQGCLLKQIGHPRNRRQAVADIMTVSCI